MKLKSIQLRLVNYQLVNLNPTGLRLSPTRKAEIEMCGKHDCNCLIDERKTRQCLQCTPIVKNDAYRIAIIKHLGISGEKLQVYLIRSNEDGIPAADLNGQR